MSFFDRPDRNIFVVVCINLPSAFLLLQNHHRTQNNKSTFMSPVSLVFHTVVSIEFSPLSKGEV